MNSGPIETIARERIVDRASSRLPTAWLARPEDEGALDVSTETLTIEDGQTPVSSSPGKVVLLMARATDSAAITYAAHAGRAGARVYLLTNATAAPLQSDLADVPRLLVRRIEEVPAEALLAGTDGAVWFENEARRWRLDLDGAQSAALRNIFLRLFWHHAIDEAWSQDGRFDFQSVGERPFDVPRPSRNAPVVLRAGDARLDAQATDTHRLTNGVVRDVPSVRRLWCPPSGLAHKQLSRLLDAGCQVTWSPTGLPDMAVGPDSGRVLLAGKASRMRIALTPRQASAALCVLGGSAEWSFCAGLRIGAFAPNTAQFWLADAAKPAPLVACQQRALPQIRAVELRDALTAAPSTWPEPSALALRAEYQWQVVPPTVSASAQPDALVNQWRNFDRDWQKQVDAIGEALKSADGLGTRIKGIFASLRGAVLGFKRKEDTLAAALVPLRAARPSQVGPSETSVLADRLAALQTQVSELIGNLEAAEKKATEDRERARQKDVWQAGVDKARAELPRQRERLTKSKSTAAALEAEIEAVQQAAKAASPELSRVDDKADLKKAMRDRKARQLKMRDDLKRAHRETTRLQGEIEALEHTVRAPFDFKPPVEPARKTKGGPGFVPTAPKKMRDKIPSEALPSVGALRKHKGKRYLVIEDWADLTEGESEAERLSARLVAGETS